MDKKWYSYFVSVDPDKPVEGVAPEEEPLYPPEPPPTSASRGAGAAPGTTASRGQRQATPTPRGASPSAAQTVADIASTIAQPKFSGPVGNPTSFEEIYNVAEIPAPPHGYTILKVAEMLRSEHLASLPPKVKRSSILVALDAAGVKIDEIIQDAVRRDRALDTYERLQQRTLDELEARKAKENRQIQAEVDKLVAEHQARIEANEQEVVREKERVTGWRAKKLHEEERIAEAVSHFVLENPITTGPAASEPADGPGARAPVPTPKPKGS